MDIHSGPQRLFPTLSPQEIGGWKKFNVKEEVIVASQSFSEAFIIVLLLYLALNISKYFVNYATLEKYGALFYFIFKNSDKDSKSLFTAF